MACLGVVGPAKGVPRPSSTESMSCSPFVGVLSYNCKSNLLLGSEIDVETNWGSGGHAEFFVVGSVVGNKEGLARRDRGSVKDKHDLKFAVFRRVRVQPDKSMVHGLKVDLCFNIVTGL